jgi:hypothetical protein
MKRGEYIAKRKEIEAECRKKLAILDEAFKLWGGNPVGSKNGTAAMESVPAWTQNISKRDAVRSAIKKLPGSFSLKDVKAVVESEYGGGIADNQLSAILSKLSEKEEITLVKKKAGKAPAVYGHNE